MNRVAEIRKNQQLVLMYRREKTALQDAANIRLLTMIFRLQDRKGKVISYEV